MPWEQQKESESKVGLLLNAPRAFQGYTLFSPASSTTTYLIDMAGRLVHKWRSEYLPGMAFYLLENGNLLRAGALSRRERGSFPSLGGGGIVQEFSWDGELIWDYEHYSSTEMPHHDIQRLPNGNVLILIWERRATDDVVGAGRNPKLQADDDLLADMIVEVKPTGKTTGEVVWQWKAWDHLVQDFDRTKPHYGDVAAHPELIDLNYAEGMEDQLTSAQVGKLRSLGYLESKSRPKRQRSGADWTHMNSIAYNAELDQIMVSVLGFNEIWIIDHSTTTKEAAGHAGGRSGKGGDILYRWGNPRTYRAGTTRDQQCFLQHDAQWIPAGRPGEGSVLVFNNGVPHRPGGRHSSVDELVLPVDKDGRYARKEGKPFGPEGPAWTYTAPRRSDFYSMFLSGAQRLPNGNTLICSGADGTFFEVTPEKDMVWRYASPIEGGPPGGGSSRSSGTSGGGGHRGPLPGGSDGSSHRGPLPGGSSGGGFPPSPGGPPSGSSGFGPQPGMTPPSGGSGGPPMPEGGMPMPGAMPEPLLIALDTNGDGTIAAAEIDGAPDALRQLDTNGDGALTREELLPTFPDQPGGSMGVGGPGSSDGCEMSPVFRAYRYGMDYPAFAGRELKAGKTIEEYGSAAERYHASEGGRRSGQRTGRRPDGGPPSDGRSGGPRSNGGRRSGGKQRSSGGAKAALKSLLQGRKSEPKE